MAEKFCLKWNDFQANVTKSFSKLRNEDDFFDVTLVSNDQQQLSAHKLVLSSCSDYFKTILKGNKHSHPLLRLEEISFSELNDVLDYIYNGEVQICQDNLERFLQVASRFQLEGLIGGKEDSDQVKEDFSNNIEVQGEPEFSTISYPKQKQKINPRIFNTGKNILSLNASNLGNEEDIDSKIEELVEKQGSNQFQCKPCGKISSRKFHAYEHAETHMEGLSFSCHMCEKTFRSRTSQRMHIKHRCLLRENSSIKK